LTAPARHRAAPAVLDHWHKAVDIRREWYDIGLATEPADRETAEEILTRLYRRHGRDRPRFVWAASPRAAVSLLPAGLPSHEDLRAWLRPRPPAGRPPLVSDIATGWSRMMLALDDAAVHPDLDPPRPVRKGDKPWPVLPGVRALEAGVPLREVLRQNVRGALRTALMDSLVLPTRAALGPPPVCWYGQQDAYWIAYYDVLRRLGLAHYGPAGSRLDDWASLARSCGWWWPGEDTCVVADRPAAVRAVPLRDDELPVATPPPVEWRQERPRSGAGAGSL
jgi:uncharacterized protein DUF6745